MLNMRLFFAGLICLLFPCIAQAGEWSLARDKNNIQVYLRDVPGSDIYEFKGITKIKTSIDSLLAVLDDTPACPEWFYQCKSPVLVERVSFTERYVYQVSDFPFPADDRDIIVRFLISQNIEHKSVTLRSDSLADYCQHLSTPVCKKINHSGLVRIVKSNGYFQFTLLSDGWVEVVWQQHLEPAGNLPKWLVNALVVDAPFESLRQLQQLVKKDKYQKAKLSYDLEGNMLGFAVKNW
jgi:hypothetical protein